MRPRLQRLAHGDEAARVGGEAALRDPRRRARSGRPDGRLGVEALAAFELEPAFAYGDDPPARANRDAARAQDAPDPAAHARIVAGEDAGIVEQGELDADPAQRVLHGKQHLDSARAAADHRDAPDLAPPRRPAQARPVREKALDGPDAKRVPENASRLAGGRSDVEGQEIVDQARASRGGHFAPREIDADRRIFDEAAACARSERSEIDAALL